MKDILYALTTQGLASIRDSSIGWEDFRGAIAYYDSRKDKLVTERELARQNGTGV
jgi:hypothetical protein